MDKPWENGEGYPDPTAYAATKPIMDEDAKVSKLIHVIRDIAHMAGFEIENRIVLRNRESGRIFK